MDCTKDNSVCSAYDVKGFPTFKYFHYFNKEQKPYDGGRTEKDFVSFMESPLSPFAGQPAPPPPPEEQVRPARPTLTVLICAVERTGGGDLREAPQRGGVGELLALQTDGRPHRALTTG